jgi:hypothetical protein
VNAYHFYMRYKYEDERIKDKQVFYMGLNTDFVLEHADTRYPEKDEFGNLVEHHPE